MHLPSEQNEEGLSRRGLVQALAAGHHLRRHPNRPPEVRATAYLDTEEARWRHPDDSEGETIERDLSAYYAWIEAEAALPEVVADHCDRLRAGQFVIILR